MRRYALTGNVAAGKSTVTARLASHGAVVIDADAIVRTLQQPGTPVFERIVAHFGAAAVAADGTLDRAFVRDRIFRDARERAALEAIVHPAVERERRCQLERAAADGAAVVIVAVPLLFEAADPDEYDGVILVDAPAAERRRRLIDDRGMAPEEADRLMASQWPAEPKRARATWIIDNDGDRATLIERTDRLWTTISR